MTIVYRSVKGSRLNSTEIDGNFQDLQNAALLSDRQYDLLLNPHGSIQQFNTSVLSAAVAYFADQWVGDWVASGGGAQYGTATSQSVSICDPAYIFMQTTTAKASLAAGDYGILRQPIEGRKLKKLMYGTSRARGSWIRFRVLASANGTCTAAIRNAGGSRSFLHTFSVTTGANDVSFYVPGDTAGTWPTDQNLAAFFSVCVASGVNNQSATLDAWQNGNFLAGSAQTNYFGTVNAFVAFSDFSWRPSSILLPFQSIDFDKELIACKRYWQKTYNYWDMPGTATSSGSILKLGQGSGGVAVYDTWYMPVEMRTVPNATFYNPFNGAAGSWSDGSNTARTVTGNTHGTNMVQFVCTTLPNGSYTLLAGHITADCRM